MSKKDDLMIMFTYGTLQRGHRLHHYVKPFLVKVLSARARGELYWAYGKGSFPAMRHVPDGSNEVVGEALVLLEPELVVNMMDHLELGAGFRGISHPLYRREIIDVHVDEIGGSMEASCYVMNDVPEILAIYEHNPEWHIPGGDWATIVKDRSPADIGGFREI